MRYIQQDKRTYRNPATQDGQLPQRSGISSLTISVSFLALGLWSLGTATAPLSAEAGGTITGQVLFTGKVPPPREFTLKKFPNTAFCSKNKNMSEDGKTRLLTRVELAKNGGLIDAIVAIRDIKDDAWMKGYSGTKVSAELCEWSDFTGVAVNRGRFIVENNDADPDDPKSASGVLHNPHAFEVKKNKSASTIFNIALAQKGDSMNKKITLRKVKAGSVVRLQCDQHEFMQAWFLPVSNPFYNKVKDDGSFELVDVPAGKHKVAAWHPIAGILEQEVDVKDGETVKVDFTLKGK